MTGRWACCPTARNADRRRPTARARCVYNGTRRRARRGRRRARGRPPVHLDSRGYVSPLGQEDQQGASPPSRPPQRPRRRVLVPRCPPFPSDDDPLPHPSQAREELARRADDRTRSILVLAQRFLLDDGLLESARALERESGVRLSQTDAADNVHLPGVIREWSAVRESTTGRRPKLTRAAGEDGGGRSAAARAAAPGRPGATAGAERRAARVAAERDAARVAERRRRDAEDAERRLAEDAERRLAEDAERRLSSPSASYGSDSTHARFDVPPGHPLLRKYAAGEGAGTRPEGGTTLSEALDFQAARRRARRGDAPAPGDGGSASTPRTARSRVRIPSETETTVTETTVTTSRRIGTTRRVGC